MQRHSKRNKKTKIILLISILVGLLLAILLPLHFTHRLGNGGGDYNMASGGYRSVMYFASWAVYQRHHSPQDLPANNLTHVIYSFANIRPESGEVFLPDSFADVEKQYPSDPKDKTGNNVYGCIKQLNLLKKRNRQLKVLVSIGGMSNSTNFLPAVSNNAGRATFASTAVLLVKNYGFDGLDIDWEFPKSIDEAQDLVLLLHECRKALNVYGNSLYPPYHFELTVAAPASYYYERMDLAGMDPYVDFWNLMGYAFTGNWSEKAGHHTNLFKSLSDPASTPYCIDDAIKHYIARGIHPRKIVLGMATYGRSFENTDGPGSIFEGVGNGTWQTGVYDCKILPLKGAEEFYDEEAGATYSYDKEKRSFISYDTNEMAERKARWIVKKGLGGGMWWESSADRVGEGSLVGSVVGVLGGEGSNRLSRVTNLLNYSQSSYENLREGFPGE